MKTKMVRLTSPSTGKHWDFNSFTEATEFLKRRKSYIHFCTNHNVKITHAETKEEFICEITGVGFPRVNQKTYRAQLCNDCARASGLCPWSKNLTPVDGWDVVETEDESGQFYTYSVLSCPMYVKDAPTPMERKRQRILLLEEVKNFG